MYDVTPHKIASLPGTGSALPCSITTRGDNPQFICDIVPWGWASCAATLIQNFKAAHYYWRDASKTDVNKFVKWLLDPKAQNNIPRNGYCTSEVYFLISDHQQKALANLITNEHCKHIDVFRNKAHGPSVMYLYRLSHNKDFQL